MGSHVSAIDYQKDSPMKILLAICLPLIGVNVLLAFTTTMTNQFYSQFIGTEAFSITGYLSTAITAFTNIIGSMMTAAWIKIAPALNRTSPQKRSEQIFHGILAIGIVDLFLAFFFLLLTVPVFSLLHIPEKIYSAAVIYYVIYILLYLPSPIAGLFLTVVNGTSSSLKLFLVNIAVILCNFFASYLLLAVFRLGIWGLALSTFLGATFQLLFDYFLFRKEGISFSWKTMFAKIDRSLILQIIRYGFLIALQNLMCTAGYLLVSYQTNRFLSLEYISVLNVSLPLTGIMSAAGSACYAFCPHNYKSKDQTRMKKFLSLTLFCCFLYGIFCFLLYAFLGNWYFGRLFDDPTIISYGKGFWFLQGIGYLFLAMIHPIRSFFDSVGMSRLSLLSGTGELLGNLFCAFYLIPHFGNIGRSLSYPLGWFLGSFFLILALIRFWNS